MLRRTSHCWMLALCLMAACRHPPATPPNVVVIVVDTLRADRLGALGNPRGLTPFLDSLAERGLVFQNAYAASSWTQPSIASLFTSRYQSQHGVIHFSSQLAESEVTLAQALREHGYATAAFSANPLIAAAKGFAKGFDTYEAPWPQAAGTARDGQYLRAAEINALARAWLDRLPTSPPTPFFLYVQYMEPHTPYAPSDEMLARTFGGRPRPDLGHMTSTMFFASLAAPDADTLRDLADVYDAEVAGVDAGIRDLYAVLQDRGGGRETILAVTADHGEELLEHGHLGHGQTLYEAAIRVPLLIVPPGGVARVDVETPVSLLDLAPTLLDMVGAPAPPSFEGRSLLPALAGDLEPRPVFSELVVSPGNNKDRVVPHERAVVLGRHKLIAGFDGEQESYDLANASDRRAQLADSDFAALNLALDGFLARVAGAIPTPPPVDPETRRRMEALGYFE